MNDVMVVAEHISGKLEEVTLELLGKGRELANSLGENLVAVLLGMDVKNLAGQMGPADKVIYMDHPNLADFNPDACSKALTGIVNTLQPKVILAPYTSMGMDLASAISVETNIPLVSSGVDVSIENGKLTASSQLYGGKLNLKSVFEGEQCIVSVIAGSFPLDAGNSDTPPEIEEISAPESLNDLKIRFKKYIPPDGSDVDITRQDILVSVGRGIQKEDNIPLVQELADALGGALSASRPVVDNKWMSKARQVGKSGVKVKPKLYLAVGISGAPEHIEGMKNAELIIAINTDPQAPIFDYANYGITEDLFEVIPPLIEKLKL